MPGWPTRGRLPGTVTSRAASAPSASAALVVLIASGANPSLAAAAASGALAASPGEVSEYRVKAELLERFTRYIEWPDPSGGQPRTFRICVWGSSPLVPELDEVTSGRKIKGRGASVRVISRLSDLDPCQVVFIPGISADALERILLRTTAKPILTVGDTAGYAQRGVLINFYVDGDHVRFEVNEGTARRSGLALSSRLMKLARVLPAEEAP